MNTYNDNLHAGVMDSLQSLDQDVKKIHSQANAAMFTLYYAEGATITAKEKLDKAKGKLDFQESVKEQAVNNSNALINLQSSAMQSNQYVKQSASNMATAAANVQIAANAIVRLSSDIGSIYNIVQAANFESEISEHASQANGYISKTAYAAEAASQTAMEASVFVAKIPGATIEEKAKSTNKLMNDLLKVVSDNFDTLSQKVADSNKALAAASVDEKKAEGIFSNLHTIKSATDAAYQLTSKELNLNLSVTPDIEESTHTIKVHFDFIRSPFKENGKSGHYPVKEYYLFLVKDKQKLNFTSSTADNILLNENSQRVISFQLDHLPIAKKIQPGFKDVIDLLEVRGKEGGKYALKDSDGDRIEPGVNYVAFLFAMYEEQYKRKLNSFDDYLSAPSSVFSFTYQLSAVTLQPHHASLKIGPEKESAQLHFTVKDTESSDQVEYRCIFLPTYNNPSVSGMTDSATIAELDKEIDHLKSAAKEKAHKITTLQEEQGALVEHIAEDRKKSPSLMNDVEQELLRYADLHNKDKKPKEVAEDFMNIYKPEDGDDIKSLEHHNKLAKDHAASLVKYHRHAVDILQSSLEKEMIDAEIHSKHRSKIGFLFNQELAEQVSAGNYTVAKKIQDKWTIQVDDSTTDNFGNLLIRDGQLYTPVVLSVSTAPETEVSAFTNNWTGYEHSKRFSIH